MAEIFEKPGSASVDRMGNRTYHRKFLIVTEYSTYPPNVWEDLTIYRNVSTFPGDSGAVAITLDCQPAGEQLGCWDVDVVYSSNPDGDKAGSGSTGSQDGNSAQDATANDQSVSPPERPWIIKFGSVHSERQLTKDVNGDPIVNTAGQPMEGITIPCSTQQITITAYRDIDTFDPIAKTLNYQDAVNNAALVLTVTPATTTTYPKWSLRCTEYACTSHSENGEFYWQVDLTLEYKPQLWNYLHILNAGTCRLVTGKPPQPILDATGHPITSPVPLDGSGQPLTAGGTPQYLEVLAYTERNFATILS